MCSRKKIIKEVLSQMRKKVKRNIQNCPLASRKLLGTHAHMSTQTRKHTHIHTHTHKLRWGRICSVIWAYFAHFIFTEEESPPGSDLHSFKKVETGYGLINLLTITHIVRINTRLTYFSTSFKNTLFPDYGILFIPIASHLVKNILCLYFPLHPYRLQEHKVKDYPYN